MKKKLTLGITIIALATMAIVGGTLAWFSDSKAVTNILNTGKIEVTIEESKFDEKSTTNGEIKTYKDNIFPGQTIEKNPTIMNGGDSAQMRYKVTVDLKNNEGKAMPLPTGENAIVYSKHIENFRVNEWVELGTVKKGARPIILFETVEIPKTWGNEYQEATLTINVQVQAVQADGTWENVFPEATAIPED